MDGPNERGSPMGLGREVFVHFLLGPLQGVADVLQPLLPPLPGQAGVSWVVQDRAKWDGSLMELARGRDSLYDGLVLDPAVVPDMVASGALLDLGPLISTDLWDDGWPGILANLRWRLTTTTGGQQTAFSVPLGAAAMALHYRSDVLAAHGLDVPRTWDQLVVAVRTVHGRPSGPGGALDVEFYGLCTLPFAGCHADAYELMSIWASFVQTQGVQQGAFFDPETFTPLSDNTGMAAAMRYYRALASYGPPRSLATDTTANISCSSMYGTATALYGTGRCAFQIAPHPVGKELALMAPSAAVRAASRAGSLPGSTVVLDRTTGGLVACTPAVCPHAEAVHLWSEETVVQAELLADLPGFQALREAMAIDAAGIGVPLANMAPVLGLSPLAVGINRFTAPLQQAYSISWVRRVTDPAVVWQLVVSPATPLAPFRYEHFSPSNMARWVAAGYDPSYVTDYLALAYGILTHGNLVSFPESLQRFLQYRAALHATAYNLSARPEMPVATIMAALSAQLSASFSPSSPGYSTLRLQYLVSIGRADLLAAPSPPPPPPPDLRYRMGRNVEHAGLYSDGGSAAAARQRMGAAVGGAVGCFAAAALAVLAAVMYRRVEKKRGWGRTKDPGIGPGTTLVVTVLWEELNAQVMDVALSIHHDTTRRVITKYAGYESVTEGDSFTVAFHNPEAAVGFSLELQSELMEQPWPEEVLLHDACRPVYVISSKRLRHLVTKAAARAAAQAEAIENSVMVEEGDASPLRTFSRATRRLDMLSGISMHVRRSMSFIHRPVAGMGIGGGGAHAAGLRGGSLLSAALAGGGSNGGTAGQHGAGPGQQRTSPGMLSQAPGAGVEASGLNRQASRNDMILERLLPFSGPAPVVPGAPAPRLLLTAARAQSVAATMPPLASAPATLATPPQRSGRRRALHAHAQHFEQQGSSGTEQEGGGGSGGGGAAALVAGATGGSTPNPGSPGTPGVSGVSPLHSLPPPPRIVGFLTDAAAGGMPGRVADGSRPAQSAASRSGKEASPQASALRLGVRRTHSTTTPALHGASLRGVVGAGSPEASASGLLSGTAGRPASGGWAFGPDAGAAVRRLSRLADAPAPTPSPAPEPLTQQPTAGMLPPTETPRAAFAVGAQLPAPPAGAAGPGPGPGPRAGPLPYHSASFSTAPQPQRRPMALDGTPGQSSRSLRGWRSWTGRSLGVLRRMHRSFRSSRLLANTVPAAAPSPDGGGSDATALSPVAPAALLSAPAPAEADEALTSMDALTSMGTQALNLDREQPDPEHQHAKEQGRDREGDPNAGIQGWEVESRSSSHHSHGTSASLRSLANSLQSTLLLHNGRRRRRGSRVVVGEGDGAFTSPETYGSELRNKWSELPADLHVDPAGVGAVLVFRGFRVRIGIHSGVRSAAQINRHHPSGRTRYSGPPLLCAKAVSDAAHGGMVFASRHSVALCSAGFLAGSGVVLWRIGDYVLGNPRLPATLYQVSSPSLVLRAALQRPLSRTFMPLSVGVLDAPLTRVGCAAIKLAAGAALLDHAPPEVGMEATSTFQALAYQYARLGGGYLAQLGAGSAMAVFGDAYRAALWAAQVHAAMFRYPWSEELLGCEHCEPLHFSNAEGRRTVVARGPRVKAVVHWGAACSMLNPLSGQLTYHGPVVDEVMRLLNGLGPSIVVATVEAAAALRRYRAPDAELGAAGQTAGASGSTASHGASQSQSQALPLPQHLHSGTSRHGLVAGDADGGAGVAHSSNSARGGRWTVAGGLFAPHADGASLPRSSSACDDVPTGEAGVLAAGREGTGSGGDSGGAAGGGSNSRGSELLRKDSSPGAASTRALRAASARITTSSKPESGEGGLRGGGSGTAGDTRAPGSGRRVGIARASVSFGAERGSSSSAAGGGGVNTVSTTSVHSGASGNSAAGLLHSGGESGGAGPEGNDGGLRMLRAHQSFTYGQRAAGPMGRPRLQDLLSVSPYPTPDTGGAGSAAGGLGLEPSAVEALIRGDNVRISRSFTFTTHRRSPLAISSYAGDPELGATNTSNSGTSRHASGLSRVLYGALGAITSSIRDGGAAVGAAGAAAGAAARPTGPAALISGSAVSAAASASAAAAIAAAADSGYSAAGEAAQRNSGGAFMLPRASSSSSTTQAAHAGARTPRRGASFSPTSVAPRPGTFRARRGSQEPGPGSPYLLLTPSQRGSGAGGPIATRTSGGLGAERAAVAGGAAGGPGSPAPGSPAMLSSTPFGGLAFEFAHSSNSAGTLHVSLTSQMRISAGELPGSGTDNGGSTDTSGAAVGASTSRRRDAAAAAAGGGAALVQGHAHGQLLPVHLDSGSGGMSGNLAALVSRVRMGLTRSRSRSRSQPRNFVLSADHVNAAATPLPTEATIASGEVNVTANSASFLSHSIQLTAGGSGASGPCGGGGGGSGGSGAALGAKVLRGGEKLPTLPEAGLAPLMREIVHLQLKLVPRAIAEEQPAAGASERGIGECVQLYRVVLLDTPAPPTGGADLQHMLSEPNHPLFFMASHNRASTTPGLLYVSSELQEAPRQGHEAQHSLGHSHVPGRQGHASALTHGHPAEGAAGGGSLGDGLGALVQARPSFHTFSSGDAGEGLEVSSQRPTRAQGQSQSQGEIQSHGNVPDLLSGTGPVVLDLRMDVAGVEAEAGLVEQFLRGFADLADPSLANLWVSRWDMSLLQDRRPADVRRLKMMMAAQEKAAEVFERDDFLSGI
ncbi:hypothetical protein GPECTOR_13g795 [Gonium pectorale]|uniref:Guanylate cyclase domain-containing protein n=1 Tax=Gonium pectorale TaxID=33097 RepID=A0A150GNE6_GONPE|nr:hypothetical protein GPECTOR_13g795 [Gonium pectorale]|eukprot:KXZ51308.1 hypothetical protein GPECTOR_13g795 [Gonium pectorale]